MLGRMSHPNTNFNDGEVGTFFPFTEAERSGDTHLSSILEVEFPNRHASQSPNILPLDLGFSIDDSMSSKPNSPFSDYVFEQETSVLALSSNGKIC